MSEELKPCPFCGGSPDIFWSEKRSHLKWSVICNDHCLTEGPMCNTEAEAVEAWNKRSASRESFDAGWEYHKLLSSSQAQKGKSE